MCKVFGVCVDCLQRHFFREPEYALGKNRRKQQMIDLAVLWSKHQPSVSAFVFSLTPDFHDCEEIIQRTAVAVTTHFDRYDHSKPFLPWAIGYAKIEYLRFRQKQGREKLVFDDELVSVLADAFDDSTKRKLEEMQEAMRFCLNRLTARSKGILTAFYGSGMRGDVVARKFSATQSAVFVSLHRTRKFLKNCIDKRISQWGGELDG